MSLPEWWPNWKGETCIIVGSGPSAKDAPLRDAKDKAKFIVINESWRLAPWAHILFGCDYAWWSHAKGCAEFQGLKLSTETKVTAHKPWNVQNVGLNRGSDLLETKKLGTVGWGGNSGFHCLNLAVQFECAKVILVGLDMTVAHGEHWHGRHPRGMNNPTAGNVARWRRAVDGAAKAVNDLSVQVINCSLTSALQNYPKMSLAEALGSTIPEPKPVQEVLLEDLLKTAPAGPRIEFGVYKGQTLKKIARHDGETVGVDSFCGMPAPGSRDIRGNWNPYPKGRLASSEAIARAAVGSGVRLIKGFVPAVLSQIPDGPYAFAHVDMDHYEATKAAMHWLWTRMLPGGIICADDWFEGRDWLAGGALNEFAAEHPMTGTSGRKAWWIC